MYCSYVRFYAEYGMQLYINKKTGLLLWPQFDYSS